MRVEDMEMRSLGIIIIGLREGVNERVRCILYSTAVHTSCSSDGGRPWRGGEGGGRRELGSK